MPDISSDRIDPQSKSLPPMTRYRTNSVDPIKRVVTNIMESPTYVLLLFIIEF